MDTPQEERVKFARVSDVVRSSEPDITEPNIFSTETFEQVSAEVDRFNKLKSSRMKELVMKRFDDSMKSISTRTRFDDF